MKASAIVYTSNTGHTAEYARIIATKTGLKAYALKDAKNHLKKGEKIIYLGWLCANTVKGYKKAVKIFEITAVCGIGVCESGSSVDLVRKATALPENIPLFTMQGGIDKTKLHGINKLLIRMITKGLSDKKDRNETDERTLKLLSEDKNYVCEENTFEFMNWYND
ncbi:MAG: hypothetical protein ACI4M6_01920 [Christensenellaceae bacterium]